MNATTKSVGMKRTFNNVDNSPKSINKRRLFDETSTFNGSSDAGTITTYERMNRPMHQNCINKLSDPSLGKPISCGLIIERVFVIFVLLNLFFFYYGPKKKRIFF